MVPRKQIRGDEKAEVPNEGYYRNPFISSLDDKWACAKVFSVNF